MAQINNMNKGTALIELIVYMGICSILFLTVISSIFYIQKIIETSNQEYYVKNELYANLNLLQQYLYKSHLSTDGKSLRLFNKEGAIVLVQELDGHDLKNTYSGKVIFPMAYVHFEEYHLEFMNDGRTLRVDFSWLDNKGRVRIITEYLIVINQNL